MTSESLLLGVGLSAACVAGLIAIGDTARHRSGSAPILTLVCFFIIASFSLAQLLIAPDLLPWLMRDAVRVGAGEPWRLLTSLLVQDGGWAGATFNLIGMLAIGTIAESLLGRRRWLMIAAVSVASSQLIALLWQPSGAGNSILNFGLAGGVCAACLMRPTRGMLVPAVCASACFVVLLVARDIHGVAAVTGTLVATAFSLKA